MNNATKVGLAMEMFLEKTAYAAGNYAKENETFAEMPEKKVTSKKM